MHASAVIATLIAAVSAMPHHPPGNTIVTGDNCGNGQKAHCCSDVAVGSHSHGVLDNLLEVARSKCSQIPIGINVPIQNHCTQTALCCKDTQNGLINLSCTNIIL